MVALASSSSLQPPTSELPRLGASFQNLSCHISAFRPALFLLLTAATYTARPGDVRYGPGVRIASPRHVLIGAHNHLRLPNCLFRCRLCCSSFENVRSLFAMSSAVPGSTMVWLSRCHPSVAM